METPDPLSRRPSLNTKEREVTETHLVAGQVWSSLASPGLQIVCKWGIVWLTQSDDLRDHVLHPGQRFLATYHGKVVVQALTAVTISRHKTRSQQTAISVLSRAWQHLVLVLAKGARGFIPGKL